VAAQPRPWAAVLWLATAQNLTLAAEGRAAGQARACGTLAQPAGKRTAAGQAAHEAMASGTLAPTTGSLAAVGRTAQRATQRARVASNIASCASQIALRFAAGALRTTCRQPQVTPKALRLKLCAPSEEQKALCARLGEPSAALKAASTKLNEPSDKKKASHAEPKELRARLFALMPRKIAWRKLPEFRLMRPNEAVE
jgi:hypothetical protein